MFKTYRTGMSYFILTVLILSVLGGALKIAGVFGERVVFENSFQYKEGMKQRAATLEAQIVEIEMNIMKFPEQAQTLQMQKKVLQIQLNSMK